jgi:hypothetical protein
MFLSHVFFSFAMAQKIWSVNDRYRNKYGNDYLKDLGFDVLLLRQN